MTASTRVARWTGGAYLALALTGMAGFLLVRPLLAGADPAITQLGIALELAVVVSQALAAIGFYALFVGDRPVAAFAVAVFGMANAVAILGSAALLMATAAVTGNPALAPGGDVAATTALLRAGADGFWAAGAVFFGLWLIPMGWYVVSTKRMPVVLGWILVVGGVGYVLSAFLPSGAVPVVADALVLPATVGELWMVGYLLVRGIRPAPSAAASIATAGVAPARPA